MLVSIVLNLTHWPQKKKGATDEMINEMIAIVGMANETNRLVEGYQVEVDDFLK